MLGILVRENEDLVQSENAQVQWRDALVNERRVRRVTLYWYDMGTGNYGPNGFTADFSLKRDCWLVRAVSGMAVKLLMPGELTSETKLTEAARVIFEAAREEKERDQEHRRAPSHAVGLRL